MKRPLVSVLIGVYNGAPYLQEAIESALTQTYEPLEVVVVDDGSTDGSGDIARSFREVRYERQERAGNGAARNAAVRLAAGGLLAFLDADDRFVPDKLVRQSALLEAKPELEAVFGHVREFVSPELTDDERASIRSPATRMPWPAPNLMLIRRESFERVGPFSESLAVGVTVDWYARALEAGLRSAMPAEIVLERRLHLANNGLRERDSRNQYLHVLKASLDRRRARAEREGGG
jgi:glycosyltransferase involved in cell wall biosynthesis